MLASEYVSFRGSVLAFGLKSCLKCKTPLLNEINTMQSIMSVISDDLITLVATPRMFKIVGLPQSE